jgi:hypothetical protein
VAAVKFVSVVAQIRHGISRPISYFYREKVAGGHFREGKRLLPDAIVRVLWIGKADTDPFTARILDLGQEIQVPATATREDATTNAGRP